MLSKTPKKLALGAPSLDGRNCINSVKATANKPHARAQNPHMASPELRQHQRKYNTRDGIQSASLEETIHATDEIPKTIINIYREIRE